MVVVRSFSGFIVGLLNALGGHVISRIFFLLETATANCF